MLTSPRRTPSQHGPRKLEWIRTIPRVGPKYCDGNAIRTIRYGEIDATDDKRLSCMARTAFLIEPIHGGAGIVVPPTGYLRQARELCSQNNVLLTGDNCIESEGPIRASVGRESCYAQVLHECIARTWFSSAKLSLEACIPYSPCSRIGT